MKNARLLTRCLLTAFLLCTIAGCYTRTQSGDKVEFAFAGWVGVAVILGGLLSVPAGWFVRRPRWAGAAHLLLGLAALAGHAAVSLAAWQAEGAWIGLATLVLMGFSELYWGGHFLFAEPASPVLACAAAAVVAYVFGWRRLARRWRTF